MNQKLKKSTRNWWQQLLQEVGCHIEVGDDGDELKLKLEKKKKAQSDGLLLLLLLLQSPKNSLL